MAVRHQREGVGLGAVGAQEVEVVADSELSTPDWPIANPPIVPLPVSVAPEATVTAVLPSEPVTFNVPLA